MKCHLSGDLWQSLHEEVRRPHLDLQRAKRMFGRLATLAHGVWVPVEALLHSLYTFSCSQRAMRRSLPVVQRRLIAQLRHAFVQ